jgi:Transmembrane family, TMEM144 of transporters
MIGIFWVPGATCGIYAIRHVGLALAVGLWSSMIVITSFFWGIVIFREEVKDMFHAVVAFMLIMAGLVGMGIYAKPEMSLPLKIDLQSDGSDSDDSRSESIVTPKRKRSAKAFLNGPIEIEPLVLFPTFRNSNGKDGSGKDYVVLFGGRISLTRRQLGILGALTNGLWGGLNLIPMHFAAREGFQGASYLISYCTGSMLVLVIIWVMYFVFLLCHKKGSFSHAMEAFPSFHIKAMWRAGLLSGSLYSIGNLSSILAVTYLGQGVGMSMCQGSLFVSGLWGIFYYGEIKGRKIIIKWFLSAGVAVSGILLLNHEHVSASH